MKIGLEIDLDFSNLFPSFLSHMHIKGFLLYSFSSHTCSTFMCDKLQFDMVMHGMGCAYNMSIPLAI